MARAGIIRGLMPRLTQAEFANSFTHLDPVFITGESGDEIKSYCRKVGLEQHDLFLKPLWRVDPVRIFKRKRTHQSWVGVSGLLEACRDLDVLETYELYHLFSGQAADVAEKLGTPLVCEVWTSFSTHPAYFIPPYSLVAKKVLRTTSLFVARSKRAASALEELGVPKRKMIYHGVNLKRFYPAKRRSDGKVRILFVGDLEPFKGIKLLLDTWPKLYKDFPNTQLWLVGSGSLLPQARKTRGVKAFGYVGHTQMPGIYRESDIFVSPSINRYIGPFLWWEEFFSYTLMEAQASGLAIVATRSGGIPEEVGPDNLLVEQGNREGLYKALVKMIENKQQRLEIGRANRTRAEKLFDLQNQTGKLERVLISFLKLD